MSSKELSTNYDVLAFLNDRFGDIDKDKKTKKNKQKNKKKKRE